MVRLSGLDITYTDRPGKAKVGRWLRTPLNLSQPLRRLERDRVLIRANEAWRADRIHRPRLKIAHAGTLQKDPNLLLHLLHRGRRLAASSLEARLGRHEGRWRPENDHQAGI